MADPLSVSAAIVGLLAAGGKIVKYIQQIRDAPQSLKDVCIELASLRLIILGLERFVDATSSISPVRAALIPVQDVIAIFTQIVLIYTELETFVQTRSRDSMALGRRAREVFRHGDASITARLLGQLQRHKISLLLVLQIIQCDNDVQAHATSERLQRHTDQELETNDDLASRLQQLVMPEDVHVSSVHSRSPSPSPRPYDSMAHGNLGVEESIHQAVLPNADNHIGIGFADILARSRPYKRTREFDLDAVSHISTTRSHGPTQSILPDYTFPYGYAVLGRLRKELFNLMHDPAPGVLAAPNGDNMLHWTASILGPIDTVYEDGVFLLSIKIPYDYPYKPPQVRFTTRILHPNIDSDGLLSLDILADQWAECLTIEKLLLSIQSLLDDPDPYNPLPGGEVLAHLYLTNREQYDATAKAWTRRYAM